MNKKLLCVFLYAINVIPLFSQSYFINGLGGDSGIFHDTVGYEFRVLGRSILVDRVGVYDAGSNGLHANNLFGIWDSQGNLLVSAIIPSGTNTTLENGSRWINLQTPITLTANTTYRVGVQANSESRYSGFLPGYGGSSVWGSVSNHIFVNGAIRNSKSWEFSYPNSTPLASQAIYGPNIRYTLVKELPAITSAPTASPILVGQALSNSTLTGGVASVNGTAVAGSFAFASPQNVPAVGNSTLQVVFTPTDSGNYTTATANVTVRVLSTSGDEDGDGLSNSWEFGFGRYQIIGGSFNWSGAKADAESKGGYLATVTSEKEWSTIYSVLQASWGGNRFWLGGTSRDNNGLAGDWRWVTGEPWSYTYWAPDAYTIDGVATALTSWDFVGGKPTWKNHQPHLFPATGYILELGYPSDPFNSDTDGDTLPDGWESNNGLNPSVADPNEDPDFDGVLNKFEFERGSNPRVADRNAAMSFVYGPEWNPELQKSRMVWNPAVARWEGAFFGPRSGTLEFKFVAGTWGNGTWGWNGNGTPGVAVKWANGNIVTSWSGRVWNLVRFEEISGNYTIEPMPAADANSNGMADAWERAFDLTSPTEDADSDGVSNADEFKRGGHPRFADHFAGLNLVGDLNGWSFTNRPMTWNPRTLRWEWLQRVTATTGEQMMKFVRVDNPNFANPWENPNWGDNNSPDYIGELGGAVIKYSVGEAPAYLFFSFNEITLEYSAGVMPASDGNNDGLADAWAGFYGVSGASGNPDGDPFTNAQEFARGSNPNEADQYFRNFSELRVVGSFTGWTPSTSPVMTLIGDNLWRLDLAISNPVAQDFKFVAGNSWNAMNWGNGTANASLPNLGSGNYRFEVNDIARNYTVKKISTVNSWPVAGSISYGQPLASSVLSGGSANIGGSFAFALPATKSEVGISTHQVVFTPTDSGNYTTATANVTVRVLSPATTAWDEASNYPNGWTAGSNGGFGFGPWDFFDSWTNFGTFFIGNPDSDGVSGMSSKSFGIKSYSNLRDEAWREIPAGLQAGQTLKFQWGMPASQNAFSTPVRGFSIYDSSLNIALDVQVFSNGGVYLSQYSNGAYVNLESAGFVYGNGAMDWEIERTAFGKLQVSATDLAGNKTFTKFVPLQNNPLNYIVFYSDSTMAYGSSYSSHYFNNLEISNSQGMVSVQGGTLPQGSGLAGQVVGDFQIGKFEVTWGEWKAVRDWAVANGYTDLANVGAGSGDDHPVRNVSWLDALKWCNAKSEMEGLSPLYKTGGETFKLGQNPPVAASNANGYRLPLEKEWEWAARGGTLTQGFIYSGSNDLNSVSWNMGNSMGAPVDLIGDGRGTWPAGLKLPNELGLFDMSGNVFEWCWDSHDSYLRRLRGGGFWVWGYNGVADQYWSGLDDRNVALGFRLARNAAGAIQPASPAITTLPTASAITFGQALSNSTLTGGVAGVNGTTVAGAFAFASPSTVPPVGNSTHQVVFTPTDSTNFTSATVNVTVSVSKAGAVISTLPTASSITFGQALSSSVLTDGAANVAGSFAFASPSAKPAAGNSTQGVVFTPSDSGNYTSATANVTVRVLQAVPEVSAWPSASPLKFGQALSASVLTGGSANVAGSFSFVNPAAVPPLGLSTQPVRFTPSDSGNYTTVSSNVTVTVDKAEPVISSLPTASAITEGQSLAASVLTGGVANVAGSFAFALPGTVPAVGNSTHQVVFSPVDSGNYTVAAGNVTVRVNALPSFSLNTTSTPGGNVTASAAGPHKQGSTVTLTAVPDGGFVFVRWAGNATGTANPLSLTVGGNLSVTAIFSQAEPADTNVQEFVGGSLLGVGPSGSVAGGANGVAATPDGGMVSVGDFTGSFQALGQNFTAGVSTTRAFTAKHGANGTLQWVVAMGANGTTAKAERVAVDAVGNVLVAGTFTGTVNFGPATHTAKGNADVFVARLGSNGTVQWVAVGGGTNSETVNGLLAGAAGEAYVTGGYFGANATFGSLALAAQTGGSSNRDAYLGRISANGTWQWVAAAGGSSTDQGRAVAMRDDGTLWWGGNFQGSAAVGPQQLTSQGATDIFVAAVDAASGNITSPLRFGGTGEDALTALVSDRVEGFYAAGSFASAMALGSVSLANNGVGDGFVARWQKNAGWTWGVALQGGDDDLVASLAMDAEGRLYAGGYFASESLTAGSNTLNNTEIFSYDGFVARITSVGGVKWLRGLRGENNDYVRGVACVSTGASTGALQLVGYTESALSGDALSLTAPKGIGDAFFVRMNAPSAAPSRTVTVNPSVGGTVALSPAGPSYPLGTQVTLTPVPAAGFGFLRWGGWASGNATPLTITVNESVSIDAEFADIGAPLVEITSPSEGMQLPSAKVDFTGRITDNVGVASAAWGLNGVEKGNLTLTQNGSFSVPAVPLVPGDNLFSVVAVDAAGNEAVEEVLLVWSPSRVFSLPAAASVNEGRTLKIPVRLTSEGGVGGFRLQVNFDPAVFSSANFSFTARAALGESLWTAPSPGRVVLLTSLGGGAISAGIQQIGELSLRVRSVPLGGLASAIGVEVLDVSNNLGNPLLDGTGSSGCTANVRSRSLPADINGNGFVDSGDGALLKTLIIDQDPARPWDVALNDLNATGSLDSGDLTKLLRIVVGFDPKPSPLVQPQAIRIASIRTMSLAPMSVAPSIPAFFHNNGTRTPVEVRVSGDLDDQTLLAEVVVPPMGSALNSLEFEMKYPADLLQIAEAQTAEAAPLNASVNPTFGNGLIRFTAFNNSPWAVLGGTVMRVTFTRISGAPAGSARHLITLENLQAYTNGGSDELLVFQRPAVLGRPMQNWIDGTLGQGANPNADSDGDGMTNRQEFLAGTDPSDRGSLFKLDGFMHDPAKGEQTLTWRAKRGVRYRVQSSENLNSWTTDNSTELLGNDGDVSLSIKPVGNKTKLFYRLQVVE